MKSAILLISVLTSCSTADKAAANRQATMETPEECSGAKARLMLRV